MESNTNIVVPAIYEPSVESAKQLLGKLYEAHVKQTQFSCAVDKGEMYLMKTVTSTCTCSCNCNCACS